MPIKIPDGLPAKGILAAENIFFMDETRALTQDIRPLKILILNLMPKKIETETQLLRVLGNSPIQIDIELMQTATYTSKNTSQEHLIKFYRTFRDVRDKKFDGMIITGAPVEQMPFENVDYWRELQEIMDWTKTNVFSTFHICWGAQAGLYHHHGIQKYQLPEKVFGVFHHRLIDPSHPLLYGFDDEFFAPHSRHTEIREQDILACDSLHLLSVSEKAGVYIVADKQDRNFFVTGHSEYDRDTLATEYFRDVDKGLAIKIPENYFPEDNSKNTPVIRWKAHSKLYSNWLNYYVYQRTPFDFTE